MGCAGMVVVDGIAYALLYCHCCCHCCGCRVGVIIVIICVVIFSFSWVSLHKISKGLVPAGVIGKIGAIPNERGGKVIDWHCRCYHCIHCCTAIVVAVAPAVSSPCPWVSLH